MDNLATLLELTEKYSEITEMYMNKTQIEANLVDANILIVEMGRGGGKTEGIIGPRTVRVAFDIPRETSVLAHTTYIALLSNIVPNLLLYYRSPRGENRQPIMNEDIHYVVGKKDLPKHFAQPRYKIEDPEHCIIFSTGHIIRPLSTDRHDSIAGGNIVHAFMEEMKHNKGDKLKSRIFPALRIGLRGNINPSPYYQGLTGVSDTARLSANEDDWFFEYEKAVDRSLITDIINTALHIEKAKIAILKGKDMEKNQRVINRWQPVLNRQRAKAVHYIRASSFVNKDVLGLRFFINMTKTLSEDEFLAAICGIREAKVANMFFALFNEAIHTFTDSYIYDSIEKFNIADTFTLTAEYLKYYDNTRPLILGYDPGSFSSITVAQEYRPKNELRIIKDFHVYTPRDQSDMAQEFTLFFCNAKNKRIILYYDRAANQDKSFKKQRETDAQRLKTELEKRGWRVLLKSERQRTIFHYEHYDLWEVLLSESERYTPRIRICANECKNLISSINRSPLKNTDGVKQLDKSSEVKLPFQLQATQSPQIASSLMYMVFGLYERFKIRRKSNNTNSNQNTSKSM
ncbi:MAG: hypothetical protein LBK94_06725 [Prevotellaceae bacterium]|jgi:hypothetical protein|nr:hypothetical protein [Prevotellaceae bacterium]